MGATVADVSNDPMPGDASIDSDAVVSLEPEPAAPEEEPEEPEEEPEEPVEEPAAPAEPAEPTERPAAHPNLW
jgi:hypothetical protein